MNSMGMQATSLHTPTEDSFSELMKSDTNLDTSGVMMGVAAPVPASALDLESSDDYFDPEELLKSPLFNDSNGRLETDEESFGNFGGNNGTGVSCSVPNNNVALSSNMNQNNMMNSEPKREFVPMGLRRSDDAGFGVPMKHTQTMMTAQSQSSYGGMNSLNNMNNSMNNNMNSNGDLYGDMGLACMQQQQQQNCQNCGMDNVASFHSGGMDNSGSSSHNNYSSHNAGGGGGFTSYRGGNQMGDDSSHAELAHDDCSVNMVNPYLMASNNSSSNINPNASFYRSAPDRNSSSASSSYSSDMTPAPRAASTAMLDLNQDSAAMFRRSVPQRSQTYHPGGESNYNGMSLQMVQQQFQLQQMQEQLLDGDNSDDGNNQLEMMQYHLQQMQELEQQQQLQQQGSMDNSSEGLSGSGLSQSMHLPSRSVSCGPMGGYDGGIGSSRSFHGRTTRGMTGGEGMMPNDLKAMQEELNRTRMMAASGTSGPVSVNDAMEKLCESMKRSAMSRTLVKQFSGRSVVARTASSRSGVPRTTSGSGMIMAMAARSNQTRQNSNRSLVMDDSSHRSTENRPTVPVRRISNTKHHLQSRGVYRHGSGHLVGVNAHPSASNQHGTNGNLSLQINGRNMGTL